VQKFLLPDVGKNALGKRMHGNMLAHRLNPLVPPVCSLDVDVEYYVDYTPHMEIVQIVLDKKLLQAADQAVRRARSNRSALVRDALREYLRRLEIRDKEERDRQGYSNRPQAKDQAMAWEAEAAWPPE
jgi:Arc/MetJ-type ribon-helix-helix transcriptional regulator